MSFDESTDSILRGAVFAQENNDGISTEALINEDYLGTSTGSLVNRDVRELLDQVFVQAPTKEEVDDDNESIDNDPDSYDHEDNENLENRWDSYVDSANVQKLPIPLWATGNDVPQRFPVNDDGTYNVHRGPLTTVLQNTDDTYAQIQDHREEMRQSQRNPLFSMLYNRIQVFLLRNGMSLEFLKIFKKYIDHLVDDGLDPLNDQYFLSLQNELSESFEFTPMMEDILNKFLLRPENLVMKLTFLEHNSSHNLLKRYMRTWKLHGELKRNLEKLAGLWHDYLRRKFLIKWNQKYEEFALHWDHQAEEFHIFTLISYGFDKWLDRIDSNDARKGLADHYFLNNVFQKIKRKKNALISREDKSENFHNAVLMKWGLSGWRLKYRETQFKGANPSLQNKTLAKFQQRLQYYQSMNNRAIMFRSTWQISPFLKKWYERTKSLDSQSDHLVELEQKFIKEQTLKVLKAQLERRKQEYMVSEHLDTLLVRFVLRELWFKRFKERLHLYSIWSIQDERTEANCFDQWKKRFFTGIKADQLLVTHSLRRYIRRWSSQLQCKLFIVRRSKRQQRFIFSKWFNGAVLEKRVSEFQNTSLMEPLFSQWRSRQVESMRLQRIADMSHEQVLKLNFVLYWHHRLLFLRALNQRAEIFEKLQALLMVKKGIAHFQEVKKLGDSFAKLMICKVFLSRHFNIWRKELSQKIQKRLQALLENYEQEQQLRVKFKVFGLWNQRTQFYRESCKSRANEINRRSLQKLIFKVIRSRLQNCTMLIAISDGFRNDSLKLSTFYTWIDHLNQLRELDARLEVESNRRDLALLLNYLNNWSMRILKSRRNYEAVQVFRNRWDRATVRGLLLVWRTRMEQSPRRHKEDTQQDFELKTPVKRISPRSSNTIPGSEVVKMHRIEAMKSHYSRVRRAIPSPVKSSLSLSSTAKKKIENEDDNVFFSSRQMQEQKRQQNQRLPPPPRLSLEKINKNLASKIDRINFERIPEVRLEPFVNSDSQFNPVIDRSLLKVDEDEGEFDESPTRRS